MSTLTEADFRELQRDLEERDRRIANEEAEACAKIADEFARTWLEENAATESASRRAFMFIAGQLRARIKARNAGADQKMARE